MIILFIFHILKESRWGKCIFYPYLQPLALRLLFVITHHYCRLIVVLLRLPAHARACLLVLLLILATTTQPPALHRTSSWSKPWCPLSTLLASRPSPTSVVTLTAFLAKADLASHLRLPNPAASPLLPPRDHVPRAGHGRHHVDRYCCVCGQPRVL